MILHALRNLILKKISRIFLKLFDWSSYLTTLDPFPSFSTLPNYSFQFLFQHIGSFLRPFVILSTFRVCSVISRFISVYLIGDLISRFSSLTHQSLLTYYLPYTLISVITAETIDYFVRRYSEAFPTIFTEHSRLRALKSLAESPSPILTNISKERIQLLLGRYLGHVQSLIQDWTWEITTCFTRGCIIVCILALQSWKILLFNCFFGILYFLIAFSFSRKFQKIAEYYSNTLIKSSSVFMNTIMHINAIQRIQGTTFFLNYLKKLTSTNWNALDSVRKFHATRWLIQLCLFQTLFVITLIYGAYQVLNGVIGLGYLLLIKWAYDELWKIFVYISEYYVSLVQQKEDARILREELGQIILNKRTDKVSQTSLPLWRTFSAKDLKIGISAPHSDTTEYCSDITSGDFSLSVPTFSVSVGERVAILGPSGSGKSTFLSVLGGLIAPLHGEFYIDDQRSSTLEWQEGTLTYVTPNDPLFTLSVKDNILLGKVYNKDTFERVLDKLCISDFLNSVEDEVGSPHCYFSSGQEQRIRLARGIVRLGKLILLDEPLTGIDSTTRMKILEFLKEELKECAVVYVTHHSDEVSWATKVYKLSNGVIKESY